MISEKKQSIIIVAGGKGVRVGGDCPKQFQLLGGEPMLMHTIRVFFEYNSLINIVVVLPENFCERWKKVCEEHQFDIPHKIVIGGETRFHSVKKGLMEVFEDETVGVHDGARPFVTSELINRCFNAAFTQKCGIVPVVDEPNSVRIITENGSRIIDRNILKIVQTPQVFPASVLKKAYDTDFEPAFTDDASVAEKIGCKIELISGDEANIKITTPVDFLIGEQLLNLVSKG